MKRLQVQIVLLCLLGAISAAQAIAPQPSGTIEGWVHNSAGEPVPGATVVLTRQGESKPLKVLTAADGTFIFASLPAGSYSVIAEKSGVRSAATQPTKLSAGEEKHLELFLSSQATAMELEDKPSFTIAGITDWSGAGGHGSDTSLRTSETLAREAAALKPSGATEISPPDKNFKDQYDLALRYKAQGDFARAREQVQKLLARNDNAELHHLSGDLNERLGDSLAAVREYERAARLDPSEQNYFDWGTELLLHRAVQPAVEVFTKGASAHSKSARMIAGLGAALYAGGAYEQAAQRLCDASDLQPSDPTPYLFLGKMEKAAPGPLSCAEDKLARFVDLHPENALAHYYAAMALLKRNHGSNPAEFEQIKSLLQRAVTLNPKLDEAYVQLGTLYSARGDINSAIGAYKKAVAANPQSAEAHYRLARAYKQIGDDANAQRQFQLYEQIEKTEAAAIERQRREVRQFLVVLKDQPADPSLVK